MGVRDGGGERIDRLLGLLDRRPRLKERRAPARGPATQVVILDGTMSSLAPGHETNAGLTYKLLREAGLSANLGLYYEAGLQWRDWAGTLDVATGRGIDRQVERAYGWLASRFRPGDRVVLLGYSRGAFAVRSLAGLIGRVGLLRPEEATARNVRAALRHDQGGGQGPAAAAFRARCCHAAVEVAALGCWDTVKALGLPLARLRAGRAGRLHDRRLGPHVARAFHALALDETRAVFAPVLWEAPPGRPEAVEQVWFRGCHGVVGGQLGGRTRSRPLANIPLTWMLGRLEGAGLPLPPGWRARFPCDAGAPRVSTWSRWGKLFLVRAPRAVGRDPSERLHPSALPGRWRWRRVPAE